MFIVVTCRMPEGLYLTTSSVTGAPVHACGNSEVNSATDDHGPEAMYC